MSVQRTSEIFFNTRSKIVSARLYNIFYPSYFSYLSQKWNHTTESVETDLCSWRFNGQSFMTFCLRYQFPSSSEIERKEERLKNARISCSNFGQENHWWQVLLQFLWAAVKRGHADKLWTFLLSVLSSKSHSVSYNKISQPDLWLMSVFNLSIPVRRPPLNGILFLLKHPSEFR